MLFTHNWGIVCPNLLLLPNVVCSSLKNQPQIWPGRIAIHKQVKWTLVDPSIVALGSTNYKFAVFFKWIVPFCCEEFFFFVHCNDEAIIIMTSVALLEPRSVPIVNCSSDCVWGCYGDVPIARPCCSSDWFEGRCFILVLDSTLLCVRSYEFLSTQHSPKNGTFSVPVFRPPSKVPIRVAFSIPIRLSSLQLSKCIPNEYVWISVSKLTHKKMSGLFVCAGVGVWSFYAWQLTFSSGCLNWLTILK